MTDQNIILTGFMGTGKTTVGKLLAKQLEYQFVDTDELIMSRCNQTIAQIFKIQGEAAFRKMEREIAMELSEQERNIISTGGKMMLDSINVEILGKKGKIFCLVANPDEIIARISGDKNIERPLLQVPDPAARIAELMKERKDGYAKFIQIDTTGLNPEEVCNTIIGKFAI
ncbi:MAG: shikimate kinase [Desulfamplus sp.]|nr:shikimate kinase [Desulfamplus sp.]